MTWPVFSLRGLANVFVAMALITGIVATVVWFQSSNAWRAHLDRAYWSGVFTYHALQNGTALPQNVIVNDLSPADTERAFDGTFRALDIAPRPAQVTIIPIAADVENPITSRPLTLIVLSQNLQYRVGALPFQDGPTAAQTTGDVFKLLTTYCSDPVVIAHWGADRWIRIDGTDVWGCHAAPNDWRLAALLGMALAVGALVTMISMGTDRFDAFAQKLQSRRQLGGPDRYEVGGPRELRSIVDAVNHYLADERDQLQKRAVVLSGVSHDLGTPATRLRLRTAVIEDAELRRKFEHDIDSMMGMIDSVLTYTRAELGSEAPRKLSLVSLLDSIVADYEDTGRPVTLRAQEEQIVQGGRSLFTTRQGQGVVAAGRNVVVAARPIALERAICNLVDNALKYGRRATVGLKTDADTATILVEDEGADTSAADVRALMDPFVRGDVDQSVDGFGLGLTIVATIARLHGGTLDFEDSRRGLVAKLTISRRDN